jgi:iron(III) transport system substrate-binding protein
MRPAGNRRRGRGRWLPLLLAAGMLLAGCGGSPTAGGGGADASDAAGDAEEVYARFNAMTGEERHRALVEAARQEGELTIYTSNTDIDDIVAGFEADYPDIKVNAYRANSETVLQRLLSEQGAGHHAVDIFETNAGELDIAGDEGLLAEYRSEHRDRVRPEGQRENWTASRFNLFVVGWNTNLIRPGQEPRTLEELSGPEWDGRISMEVGDVDWFAAMYNYYLEQGMTEQEVMALFGRLAAGAKIVRGHTVQGELLSAGQFAVAVSAYSHTIDKAARDGAPVAWRPATGAPVQPVVIRPNGVGLVKTAPHPAAALLFMDYELTEAQQIFADATRIPAVATADDPLAGLETYPVPDDQLLRDAKRWSDRYEQVVRRGEQLAEQGQGG